MPYIFIRLDCLFETSVYIPNSNKLVLVLVAGPFLMQILFCRLVCGNLKGKCKSSLDSTDLSL